MDEAVKKPRAWLEPADSADGPLGLRIGGELDLDSIPEVEETLDALLARHQGHGVRLDLGQLSFVDSSGLAVLIRIANDRGPMRIAQASPAVRRVIEVLGLAGHLGLDAD